MSKIVLLFLIFIAVLAIFGRLRLPRVMRKREIKEANKCPDCGTYKFDGVNCGCEEKGK